MLYFITDMKNIKGVTLIELISGIVIVAIISVASFEFFRHCQRFIVDSEIRLGAVNFARETMEFHSWDVEIGYTTDEDWENDTLLPTSGTFGRIRDVYGGTRQYRVKQDTEETGDYKVIDVKVNWAH